MLLCCFFLSSFLSLIGKKCHVVISVMVMVKVLILLSNGNLSSVIVSFS